MKCPAEVYQPSPRPYQGLPDSRLPTVLSREEVSRLIDAAGTLFRRTLLMTLYGTGMRRAELARLKVSDIDSQRMIIRVVAGKGGKDRDLPLSPIQVARDQPTECRGVRCPKSSTGTSCKC
jgi:integrase